MSFQVYPSGDAAATIDLGNQVNEYLNQKIIAMQQWLDRNRFKGMNDIIIAYASLTVLYDPIQVKKHYKPSSTVFDFVHSILQDAFDQSVIEAGVANPLVRVPVCYDPAIGIDLETMAMQKNLLVEDIIRLHTEQVYRVYMIGFLPAFAYMASVHEKLVTARKHRPVQVMPGSVGIAGVQTGIYPFASPGGWHIIGRTPWKLFDAQADVPVKIQTGDRIQFYAINRDEFEQMEQVV